MAASPYPLCIPNCSTTSWFRGFPLCEVQVTQFPTESHAAPEGAFALSQSTMFQIFGIILRFPLVFDRMSCVVTHVVLGSTAGHHHCLLLH
eukprot:jgi/Botrbrau1/16774/Bobra.150_2s0009.1